MEILPGKLDNLVRALVQTGAAASLGRKADPRLVSGSHPRFEGAQPAIQQLDSAMFHQRNASRWPLPALAIQEQVNQLAL